MIPNNETERILNATNEELDAMQYITASKIIHLKNKYKDPELRILWERSYARRMIQSMQEKLNVYEHGYRWAIPLAFCLGILSAFVGWFWDFQLTISSTHAFAIGSLLLFNIYVFGKTILLFETSGAYAKERQQELKEHLLAHYAPPKNEQEGEWITINEASEKLLISTKILGKILKENGFVKKRDSKQRYVLVKKLYKK